MVANWKARLGRGLGAVGLALAWYWTCGGLFTVARFPG
ncbi:MAG: hypothetical protein ACI8T1_000017 [Verrucomicrobiales bacterium]|jgi:hypothetical protein